VTFFPHGRQVVDEFVHHSISMHGIQSGTCGACLKNYNTAADNLRFGQFGSWITYGLWHEN